MIRANKSASNAYRLALDPVEFLRATGEDFAQCDSEWKRKRNNGQPCGKAIAELVAAGAVHIDALVLCDMRREALLTAVTILISVDMNGMSASDLPGGYIDVARRMVENASWLREAAADDEFACNHAAAILANAAEVYARAFAAAEATASPAEAALCEGCVEYVKSHSTADKTVAELLVDILSRMQVI